LKIMSPIIKKPDGVVLKVFVQPKSTKNEIVGIHEDAVKIRLTAPPIDNAANEMCVKFHAKQLGIPKSAMKIISGNASRHKQLFISYAQDSNPAHPDNIAALLDRIENQIQSKKP